MPGKKVNLDHVLEKAVVVMKRDVEKIYTESIGGKLSAGSSRDLCNYLKLLTAIVEARKEAEEELKDKSDKELEAMIESPKK